MRPAGYSRSTALHSLPMVSVAGVSTLPLNQRAWGLTLFDEGSILSMPAKVKLSPLRDGPPASIGSTSRNPVGSGESPDATGLEA